ncbi:MAG TPA: FecR family protein, partial [Candidatus Polarisedimenticolia bacterium]|nr:FecR family protein [Candidatus Polarisedimenticolia bacterium]
MTTLGRTTLTVLIALTSILALGPSGRALAQEAYDDTHLETFQQSDLADQAGAVYGRLRHIEGTLQLRRDDQILSDLVINEPIAPGDVLITGPGGRAEIQLADGSVVMLDSDSELVLQSLSDGTSRIEDTTILQLPFGAAIVMAEAMDSSEKRFQIDTDAASVFLLSDGIFRIDADSTATTVISRRGVAEVMSQEVSTMARSGERVTVRGGQIPGEPQIVNTRLTDGFDQWAAERQEALVREARHDEDEPVGLPEPVRPYASELSYYGNWYNNPSYGWVWRPVGLASDWQPYLYGRWTYSPAGMVWVSYEPWGWAPFHYGRWEFLVGSGWVWIPGHVFSGAYVAWSVSPGYFGWCPLGYYDRPVSFHFGAHRAPWVYVRGDRLYARRIHTIIVRDTVVLRDIERRRVVVRGHPRIDPRRVHAAPRLTEELHRTFSGRPQLQLRDDEPARRMPFRENERQRLVRLNNRRQPGAAVPRVQREADAGAGRPGARQRPVGLPAAEPSRPAVRRQPDRPVLIRG